MGVLLLLLKSWFQVRLLVVAGEVLMFLMLEQFQFRLSSIYNNLQQVAESPNDVNSIPIYLIV